MSDDAMARFEMVQQALQQLDGQLSRLEQTALDLRRAMGTLEAVAEADGEQDTLIPIGGGVHLRARIDAGHDVVSPLGRGYAADQGAAAARDALQTRLSEVESLIEERGNEAQRLSNEARSLAQQIQGQS